MKNLELELAELGLTDKESRVYIAILSLGSSTVQTIARKSQTARATTYLVLERLIEYGLITQFTREKKTLYTADSPLHLASFVNQEEERVAVKKQLLNDVVPKLFALTRKDGKRAAVRYYEGLEELKKVRQEMVSYTPIQGTWYVFIPLDQLNGIFGHDFLYARPRTARGIKTKTIFTTQSTQLRDELLRSARHDLAERKYLSIEQYPDDTGFIIFHDRLVMTTLTANPYALIIESEEVAHFMRTIFEIVWQAI